MRRNNRIILLCLVFFVFSLSFTCYGKVPEALKSMDLVSLREKNSLQEEITFIVELEGEMIFDDNYFSLLPGEKRRIHYSKSETDDISICGYSLK